MRKLNIDVSRGYNQIGKRCINYIKKLEDSRPYKDLLDDLRSFNGNLDHLEFDTLSQSLIQIENAKKWTTIIIDPIEDAKRIVADYRNFLSHHEFLKSHNSIVVKTENETFITPQVFTDYKEFQSHHGNLVKERDWKTITSNNYEYFVHTRKNGRPLLSLTLNVHELCHLEDSYKKQRFFELLVNENKSLDSYLKSIKINLLHYTNEYIRKRMSNEMKKESDFKTDQETIINNILMSVGRRDAFDEICRRRNVLHFFDDKVIVENARKRMKPVKNIDEIRENKTKWDILGWISEGIAYKEIERAFRKCTDFNREIKDLMGLYASLYSLTMGFWGLKSDELKKREFGISIDNLAYRPRYHIGIGFVEFWSNRENYWKKQEKTFLGDLISDPNTILENFSKKYDLKDIERMMKPLMIHW
ncbi:MAG: hypothetical protein ACFE9L_18310 [Candidatus Hodarchaeota archaeon]